MVLLQFAAAAAWCVAHVSLVAAGSEFAVYSKLSLMPMLSVVALLTTRPRDSALFVVSRGAVWVSNIALLQPKVFLRFVIGMVASMASHGADAATNWGFRKRGGSSALAVVLPAVLLIGVFAAGYLFQAKLGTFTIPVVLHGIVDVLMIASALRTSSPVAAAGALCYAAKDGLYGLVHFKLLVLPIWAIHSAFCTSELLITLGFVLQNNAKHDAKRVE
eukprot:Hpha_TRINITY_DN18512_c0_g1::TRINITY_DN18512_c0_g1_i1::g.195119::m.195119